MQDESTQSQPPWGAVLGCLSNALSITKCQLTDTIGVPQASHQSQPQPCPGSHSGKQSHSCCSSCSGALQCFHHSDSDRCFVSPLAPLLGTNCFWFSTQIKSLPHLAFLIWKRPEANSRKIVPDSFSQSKAVAFKYTEDVESEVISTLPGEERPWGPDENTKGCHTELCFCPRFPAEQTEDISYRGTVDQVLVFYLQAEHHPDIPGVLKQIKTNSRSQIQLQQVRSSKKLNANYWTRTGLHIPWTRTILLLTFWQLTCNMCNLTQCKATLKGAEIVIQIYNLIAHMEMLPSLSNTSAMKFWRANYPETLKGLKLISSTSISSENKIMSGFLSVFLPAESYALFWGV